MKWKMEKKFSSFPMRINHSHFKQQLYKRVVSFWHVGILSNDNLINFCVLWYSQQILIQLKLTFKMATAEKRKEKKTATRKTFWKLSCQGEFEYEINDEDNIIKLIFKIRSTYLQQIRVELEKKYAWMRPRKFFKVWRSKLRAQRKCRQPWQE